MSQYTFDTASLTRVHTEDRKGAVKTPKFDWCAHSTIFDAGPCDSPAACRHDQAFIFPHCDSPLSSKLSLACAAEKAPSRESPTISGQEKDKIDVAQQAVDEDKDHDPKDGKATPHQSHIKLAGVFKRFGLHPSPPTKR
ncbi:uncharacterized protein FIBRA_04893 [Fibroporia radiculosa]|uniref:Uncharacterized protein n=1 Tax=Fibroporia radiculosa TaxID=599839 RepID=J4H375_9APHY|nr:uncharacterized protein FIBRA_04893 [Fibroporia radiculosa]CCM02784.1 predicted protein [Fibroporia radiculosa]